MAARHAPEYAGEYSVNDAPFTSVAGTIHTNDKVRVRVTSANTFATPTTATLTVGNVSAPFNVVTKTKADVTALPTFPAESRVLVLVSCKLNGSSDGDDDSTCVSQRVRSWTATSAAWASTTAS